MRLRFLAVNALVLALVSLWSKPVKALELRAGQSWFEQGDYLLEPGITLGAEDAEHRSVRFEFTGKTFGNFTQATGILSLNLPFKIFPWESVYTSYGLSLMDEYTAYNSPHGKDESIHSMNLGLNLGLGWKVWQGENWSAQLEWNSHIFAAGLAFIFMTTARKTVFTAAVGYEL
ncbi:MAG: hypothetical protein H7318_09510 [Oligoflexus sp.]|nr:hypothetical protein [Oligoflexus sp.]